MAVGVQLAQGVGEVRRPEAVAPVDRQREPASGDLALERGLEGAVLLVDGADAAKMPVVVRHLLEPLVGDAAAAGDVAQVGDDVVLALRAAEAGEQDAVVGRGGEDSRGCRERGLGHDASTSTASAVVTRLPV